MNVHPEIMERWNQAFGFQPTGLTDVQLRERVSSHVRQLCTELAQREDRKGIADILRRIAQAGSVLEDAGWFGGR
jgi:hypothetical protein